MRMQIHEISYTKCYAQHKKVQQLVASSPRDEVSVSFADSLQNCTAHIKGRVICSVMHASYIFSRVEWALSLSLGH